MNIAMWGQALRIIPRLTKSEWNALDVVAKWLIATRSAVLVMTFLSAAVAGVLAFRDGRFDLWLWLILTAGLILAHATNNLVNDLTDYSRGVDKDNYFRAQYGPQPLEHGLMSVRQSLTYIAATGLIALAAGVFLVYVRGNTALLLLAAGVFFVLFYTFPLKYIGLGELAVLVVWGPLMIGGGYYVVTGSWDWNVAIASLPYALGVTTVIFGKHIDKCAADAAKHIRTVPVLLGERASRYAVMGMFALQYLLVVYLVGVRFFTPAMLVVVVALTAVPTVWRVYRQPKPETMPAEYRADIWPLWFVALAFYHNRRFGGFFLAGLFADAVLHNLGWLV